MASAPRTSDDSFAVYMRPLVYLLLGLSAAFAAAAVSTREALALFGAAISILGSVISSRSPAASAAAFLLATLTSAFTRAVIALPLIEACFILSAYDSRASEFSRRLVLRGYDGREVEAAMTRAEMHVAGLTAAAVASSYAVYFSLLLLPRLPPAAALALSSAALASLLILIRRKA